MSRTSKALRRLGVPALAALTVMAVVPTFTSVASAAVTGITLSPDTTTAPAGTCQQLTAQLVTQPAGSPSTATVDVQLAPTDNSATAVTFCTVAGANGTTPATPDNENTIGVNGRNGEFVTDNTGKVVIGVATGNVNSRTVNVTAYVEGTPPTAPGQTTGNGIPDGSEPKDTSTVNFTAGGAQAATAVTATPADAVRVEGGAHTFTANVTNGSQPLPGVTPVFDVTAGPDAVFIGQQNCGVTNQAGDAVCTFTNQGGTGSDTVVVYVNKSSAATPNTNDPNSLDSNEPSATIRVTFQGQQPAGTTLAIACGSNATNSAGSNCQNPTSGKSVVFTVTVKNSAGTAQQGVAVSFSGPVSSGTADSPNTDTETLSANQCQTAANGQCSVTLTDSKPTEGETLTVTASIVNTGNNTVTAPGSVTFHDPTAAEARTLTLTPESATGTVGSGIVALTATTTDRFGNPVPGVEVTFTEGPASGQSGTGRFVNNSSTFTGITNASGQIVAELKSEQGEAPGSTTVTATITGFRSSSGTITPRTPGTANDECEQPANTTTAVAGSTGNAPGAAAGDCDDTSVVNFTSASSPSPTPSPTATASPGAPCSVPGRVVALPSTINATGHATMNLTSTPGRQVQLLAYSRPSTTFKVVRTGTADANGHTTFVVTPPTNTRLYAQEVGCTTDPVDFSIVLLVRPVITLAVQRNGPREYTFSGTTLPRIPGSNVNLYRVGADGSRTLQAIVRTDSSGRWTYRHKFLGTGRFEFSARAGGGYTNTGGESNVRSLLVF